MYPLMRTLPALMALAVLGCADTAAPHGANFASLNNVGSGSCGRTEQEMRCWGNLSGLALTSSATPTQPGSPYSTLQILRAGTYEDRGCGLDGGALFCWDWSSQYTPVAPELRFSDVAVGGFHQCALGNDAVVYCWGGAGQAGVSADDPAIVDCDPGMYVYLCVPVPTPIASTERFTSVAAGEAFSCATTQTGQVLCWGDGYSGQLGTGPDITSAQTPAAIDAADHFTRVAAAGTVACATNPAGGILCWGQGPVGNGTNQSYTPVAAQFPSGTNMRALSVAIDHACALDGSGQAWCWGSSSVRDGSVPGLVPTQVLGGLTFSSLATGYAFTCGIAGNGAWCWGINNYGQLGNGGTGSSPIPVRVANQDQFDD